MASEADFYSVVGLAKSVWKGLACKTRPLIIIIYLVLCFKINYLHQETEEVVDPEKERKSYKQTETSRVRLEKLGTDGNQLVTNVAIATDSKEVSRRQEEVEAKKAR